MRKPLLFSFSAMLCVAALWGNAGQTWEEPFIELKVHTNKEPSVIFLPDGKRIITLGTLDTIWDVETGKELGTLPAMFLSLSPDGKKIAAGPLSDWSESGESLFDVIVDAESGKELRALSEKFLGFALDGKKIVMSTGTTVRIWDWERLPL